MKKNILILMLGVLLPLNITFASSGLTEFDGNRVEFIEENLSKIIEIVNSVPGLDLSDLGIINTTYLNVVKVDAGEGIKVSHVKETDKLDFEVDISSVSEILDKTVISYDVDLRSDSSNFSFWKIRLRCEDGIKGYIVGNTNDMCGDYTENHNVSKDGGKVTFVNNNDSLSRATVKFRAFDSYGNWLGSRSHSVRLQPSK